MSKPDPQKQLQDSPLTAIFNSLVTVLEKNNKLLQLGLDALRVIRKDLSIEDTTPINREEKVKVEIKCSFLKIDDIDTVNQHYSAEISVQAKWQEPALKTKLPKDVEQFDGKGYWLPRLHILNLMSDVEMEQYYYCVKFDEPGYKFPIVILLWRFKSIFRENLELEHFPVDVQDLTIQVASERTVDELDLVDDEHMLSTVNTEAFMDAQEWDIYHHVETFRDTNMVDYGKLKIHPVIHVQCRVARKVGYFAWNIIFIMFLIIAVAFASISLNPNGSDRLVVTITLLLTAIAFKMVVQQSLPTISYLTYLDVYILASLIFLVLHAAQNSSMAYMSQLLPVATVNYYDKISVLGLCGILFVFHVIFATFIFAKASKKRRLMKRKDRSFKVKQAFVQKHGRVPHRGETVTPKTSAEVFTQVNDGTQTTL